MISNDTTRTRNSMMRDDRGASILLEYILSIVITSVLFAVLLLVLNSLLFNTDTVITEPQLTIIANDIANQLSSFANEVNFNRHADSGWNGDMSDYSTTMLLPDLVQDKQYAVRLTYDDTTHVGNITIWLTSNPDINQTMTYNSPVKVAETTFYNSLDRGTIAYDAVGREIEVTVG